MVLYICFFPTAQTKNRLPLFSALAGCRAVNVIPIPPIGGDSVLFEEKKQKVNLILSAVRISVKFVSIALH